MRKMQKGWREEEGRCSVPRDSLSSAVGEKIPRQVRSHHSFAHVDHPKAVIAIRLVDKMPSVFRGDTGDCSVRDQGRLHGEESN